MTMTVQELQDKRNKIIEQARKDYDAKRSNGGISAEDEVAFDRAIADAEGIDREIRTWKKLNGISEVKDIITQNLGKSEHDDVAPNATAVYTSAFRKLIRGQKGMLTHDEQRALMSQTTDGSNLISREFENTIVAKLAEANIFRQAGFPVIKTSTTRDIPVATAMTSVAWLDEGQQFSDSQPGFGKVTLGAYKCGALSWFSTELAEDTQTNFESFLANDIATALGQAQEKRYATGTGTGQPQGLFTAAPAGVTSTAGTITGDDLIGLMGSLPSQYRSNSVFVAADSIWSKLMRIKDGAGAYAFIVSLRDSEPSRLLGRPIHFTSAISASAVGDPAISIVDPRYFIIGDRGGMFVKNLQEARITEGFLGLISWVRTDSRLLIPDAARKLVLG